MRSSCDASATNCRCRASVASVSPRASLSANSMLSSVLRQLGDLVVGLGMGDRQRRVARARDRARGVGEPRDRRHRARRGGEAGEQRERRAAQHAEAEEHAHAVLPDLDVGELARVLDEEHAGVERHRPRLDQVPVPLLRGLARRHEVRRVVGLLEHLAVAGDEPDDRVLARRGVGVEVRAVLGQRIEVVLAQEAVVVVHGARAHRALQGGRTLRHLAVEVRPDAAASSARRRSRRSRAG